MGNLLEVSSEYLEYCALTKRLDSKTIRAYKADLRKLCEEFGGLEVGDVSGDDMERYVVRLHSQYKPRSVKRKIASVKALFHYMEYRGYIDVNLFAKINTSFREPQILPKTIPLYIIESILSTIYARQRDAATVYRRRNAVRDAALCEMLFATGMRISEICGLKPADLNMRDSYILIYGKGAKERRIHICNAGVLDAIEKYMEEFKHEIDVCGYLFANQSGNRFSDQAVRRMLNYYSNIAGIEQHITPHMFRHTFATSLLEADVDIRYIQEMLGHSSIHTTEIYTHVSMAKQKDILTNKHPRNMFDI